MLPWIFSVMNHWRGQNVVRTSVTYSAVSRKQRFCFFIFRHHLWSTSAQVQDNIESACWIHITKMRPFKDDFFIRLCLVDNIRQLLLQQKWCATTLQKLQHVAAMNCCNKCPLVDHFTDQFLGEQCQVKSSNWKLDFCIFSFGSTI